MAKYRQGGHRPYSKIFLVAKADIVANDYDLSINRYKEIVYETIAYETPSAIITQIKDLQTQRQQAMEALEKMLNAKM